MTRYLIPLGVFLVIGVFLGIGLTMDPRRVPSPLIDKPIPQFELPRLKARDQVFSDRDLKGKVSLFNVWASWCVACRQEHPVLMQLASTGEVPIYGLNYKDQHADALNWLAELGDPYTATAYDFKGRVAIDWGVYGVPETFIIDAQGIIRHKHIGPISPKALREEVLPLVRRLREGVS